MFYTYLANQINSIYPKIDNIMKYLKLLFAITALSALSMGAAEQGRTRECFDRNWKFHKGDIAIKLAVKGGMQGGLTDANVKISEGEHTQIAYTDRNKVAEYKESDWSMVNLPHDWLVEEPFVHDDNLGCQWGGNGYKPNGIGFYRKEFTIPKEDLGKIISIEFDGIFRNSTVWVNGHLMGNQPSGYLPSTYDITDVARYGDEGSNVILVKVDATDYEGWWYEGCGIYRHVWINMTSPLHIRQYGTFVTTPVVSDSQSVVNAAITISNRQKDNAKCTLVSEILDGNGNVVGSCSTPIDIEPYSESEVLQQMQVDNPNLWSPETPYLYRMRTRIMDGNELADEYVTPFGIRSIDYTTQGFFLNGKPYQIKGTCNHQDHAGVGVAVPDELLLYRLRLLKEMGSNGYRCSHNPPSPQLLDMCDSIGMIVIDENRKFSSTPTGLNNLTTLVMRDCNHPSVCFWSLENEENLEGTEMGARILGAMNRHVKSLDHTRPTTAAINHGWNDGGYSDQVDIVGYNYGQRGMQYVKEREAYPDRKMLVTESTSYVATRGEHWDNWEKGYMSNFGKGVSWGLQPGEDWKHIVDYPCLGGTFVWTGFDYRGEPTPYLWPCINSHFGIMDMCGFPKDGYYGYKAAWTHEPLVHAYPHWNLQGHEGDTIRMGVYTNCEEVEMLVNGRSLGRKKAEPYIRLEWNAIYKPGVMEVRGYNGGKQVASEKHYTTGEPYSISAIGHKQALKANGTDLVVVNIDIKDKKGRTVPTADNLVNFTVSGPAKIIGVGNGDPSSHEADKAECRNAFNGRCQVILQATDSPGEISLSANSEGLKGTSIEITSK